MLDDAVKEEFASKSAEEKLAILQYQVDKFFGDQALEIEDYLARVFGLDDYPDDEEYDGPTMRLPDGTGYCISYRVERVDEKGEPIATDTVTD